MSFYSEVRNGLDSHNALNRYFVVEFIRQSNAFQFNESPGKYLFLNLSRCFCRHEDLCPDTICEIRYVKYQNWKLKEFLEESDLLNKKREELKKDISNIYKNINDVKKENKLFREEFYLTENDKKKINQEEEKRIKLYIKKYKNQIRVITMRIKLLKHCFNNLNKTLKYLNLNKKNISNNEKNNDEDSFFKEVDTSQLPIDLSRKINNYMDFSTILNKKYNNNDESKISELGKTGNFGQANISVINMWDISVINNN